MREKINKKYICVKRTLAVAAAAVFALSACVSCGDKEKDKETAAEYRTQNGRRLAEIGTDEPAADSGNCSFTSLRLYYSESNVIDIKNPLLYDDLFGNMEFIAEVPDYYYARINDPKFIFEVDNGENEEILEMYYGSVLKKSGSTVLGYTEFDEAEQVRLEKIIMKVITEKQFLSDEAVEGEPIEDQSGMYDDMKNILSDGEFYESATLHGENESYSYLSAAAGDYHFNTRSAVAGSTEDFTDYELVSCGDVGYEYLSEGVYEKKTAVQFLNQSFAEKLISGYWKYDGGYHIKDGDRNYICERYIECGSSMYFVLLDENEKIAGVTCISNEGISFLTDYSLTDESQTCNKSVMKEHFETARKARGDDGENSCIIAADYGFNVNNKFDFEAEKEKGETVENPHIVESYREFFDSADEFTIRITTKTCALVGDRFITKSNNDYFRRIVCKADDEKPVWAEDMLVNKKYYQRIYNASELTDFVNYPLDEKKSKVYICPVIQKDSESSDNCTFKTAYKVTIGDEEYICEVWNTGEKDYYFYCKDNIIVAYEEEYSANYEIGVIEFFSDKAQTEYIAEPETSVTYSEENFAQQ